MRLKIAVCIIRIGSEGHHGIDVTLTITFAGCASPSSVSKVAIGSRRNVNHINFDDRMKLCNHRSGKYKMCKKLSPKSFSVYM